MEYYVILKLVYVFSYFLLSSPLTAINKAQGNCHKLINRKILKKDQTF